jgi:hypothetical protein
MNKDKIVNVIVLIFTAFCLLLIVYPFLYPSSDVASDIQKYSATVLAFLTLLYVLLTFYIVKSNSKSLKELLRPYIVVTFPIKYNRLYFSIKNIGRRPAKNLNINIEPEIGSIQQQNLKGNCNSLLKQTFVAPEQEFINIIDLLPSILRNQSEKIFNIKTVYEDLYGEIFTESFTIILSNYLYNEMSVNKDINDNLQLMNDYLKTISENLKNYSDV